MKEIRWLVRVKRAPAVDRHCKKCGGKAAFRPSGLFRVNAQQKSLDVWLIYKCAQCESTWNLTVLSRVNPRSIPPETLRGFHRNDEALAMRYSLDTALIRRGGGEPGAPEIEIVGEEVLLSEPTRLRLIPQHPLGVKVSVVLRARLGVSRSEFDRLCAEGRIRCVSNKDLKRCRLSGEVIFEIG